MASLSSSTVPEIRVLLVTPEGCTGGAENLMLSSAIHLPSQGVVPTLLSMRPGPLVERATRAGVAADAFEDHRYRHLGAVVRATRWLTDWARKTRAHLIHATHTAHLYGSFAGRSAGIPVVWHLHDHPFRRDPVDLLLRRLPVSHTIFATHAIVRSYPRQARGHHSVIHPTCVDMHALHQTQEDTTVRQRFDLPEGPLFLTVARMQAYKGHRYLIEAAALVLREFPQAVFAIVGKPNGPAQERYFAEIRMFAESTGVAHRVRFLGFVGDRDLVNLYRAASGVVHPAVGEGYSVTLQEAMSFGVPVIAAEADGPRELVENERTGLLVPTRDSTALAGAIQRLLRDHALAKRLSEAGRTAAHSETLHTMIARSAQAYREVLHRRPS